MTKEKEKGLQNKYEMQSFKVNNMSYFRDGQQARKMVLSQFRL